MKPRTLASKIPILLVMALAAACGGDEPGQDAGPDDAGIGRMDAGPTVDAGETPSDAGGGDACTPRTECAPDECGPVDDGCGGTLQCEACDCTPETFTEDCPSRPCEVASACEAGACVYEPLICELDVCACPDGETCDDTTPRPCGDGCPALVCDPQPSDVGGRTVYANACVPRQELRCGLCELGALGCGTETVLACEAPDLPWIDAGTAECNGASPISTVVYVDELVETGTPDGSREQPFNSVADGIAAAITRGARLVVIGRSPEVLGTQGVVNGVSVLGGFSGWPDWQPDPNQRPIFHARAEDVQGGRLVGLRAENVVDPTRIEHVRVVTDDLTGDGGESNIGVVALGSPALELVDVIVDVGAAADGTPGASGLTPVASGDPAQNGRQGYGNGGNVSECSPVVAGGQGGTRLCDGVPMTMAAGGDGGGGSGAMPRPVSSPDQCSTSSNLACYHVGGQDSPGGAQGGQKSRPALVGDGEDGGPTSDGGDGGSGQATVELQGGLPVPTGVGEPGQPGEPGRGGGGGSTGQITRTPENGSVSTCSVGGSGGGGGAGGCGGGGGGGGGPGGWSFGLVVSGSAGLVLDAIDVSVGAGGVGGAGGAGAPGTAGGPGGAAGPVPGGPARTDVPLWGGSRGGDGSDGGRGGTGGPGAPGAAVGIFCGDHSLDVAGLSADGPQGFEAARGCE